MAKKRFRCRIGLHDWQRVEGSKYSLSSCFWDDGYGCDHPLWDKVCIAPGCRATKPTATNYKEKKQRSKDREVERGHLAKLKMELIEGESE